MINYRNLIDHGTLILKKSSIPTAQLDAEILLSLSLNESRERILLDLEKKINLYQLNHYIYLINRRKKLEPISLISGKKFFWKQDYIVNQNVLTPRYETELLVEETLKICGHSNHINVLDIGVGSGCILISLFDEKKNWRGTGIDISKQALKIAKTNAKIQQVQNRIKFIKSDIDKFKDKKYDLIVTNPPYISKVEYNNLNLGVKDYEPITALYGGINGFETIEKIIKRCKVLLKIGGLLAMEIGINQHKKVSELLKLYGFYVKKTIKDYQKIKRCIFAIKIK